MNTTLNRETWLNKMAALMAPRFEELGHPLPLYRVTVGFTSAGKSMKVAGECWHSSRSADKTFEIMISPVQDDSMDMAGVLAHELIHAAVGFEHKHKGDFAKVALALGLNRPMTATTPGPAFKEWAAPFIEELGPIPHAKLSWMSTLQPRAEGETGEDGEGEEGPGSSNAKPKQKTRMVKCKCRECGYVVRTTLKWIEKGAPHCPDHGAMDVDAGAMADAPKEDA
ncbi:hypothetical protein D3C87_475530 [compost metagenome]